MYKQRYFSDFNDVVEFLNDNKILKEDIINIEGTLGGGVSLIYWKPNKIGA